jgi:hypothetical protein
MHNKIKSVATKGTRRPGRPFNTTKHPWRSIAIGKSFVVPGRFTSGGAMYQTLKEEGYIFSHTITSRGLKVTRLA